jgi:hypothetical protein
MTQVRNAVKQAKQFTVQTNELFVTDEWGSQFSDYRNQICSAIRARIELERSMSAEERDDLENLSRAPELSEGVFSGTNISIGFHVEIVSRVKAERLVNVATVSEIESAPGAAYLWAAKEATYKALCKREDSSYLSDIQVEGWRSHRDLKDGREVYSFSARLVPGEREVNGFALREGACILAVSGTSNCSND